MQDIRIPISLFVRLYDQLEEVKERRAQRAREEQRADVQSRRKEYGSKLATRVIKKS